MSTNDMITLPQILSRIPGLVANLPNVIKGTRMSRFHDPDQPIGLGLAFQQAVELNPAGLALVYEDRRISYTQLNAWANRIAHYLLSIGLRKGDVVAVDIENRPELLAVVIGCAKIGAVNAMINTSQKGRVLAHSYNLVKPRLAIVGEERRTTLEEVREQLDLPEDAFYWMADRDTLEVSGCAPEGYHNLTKKIRDVASDNPETVNHVFLHDPLFYIYTSGTTGLPKAVVFKHGRWWKAYGGYGFLAVQLKRDDRMYIPLPFYHATGMVIGWGSVIAGGATLVLARKFSASRFWDDIRRHDCTAFTYIGELCRYLMQQPRQEKDRDHKVRVAVGNGMRPGIWEAFKSRFGVKQLVELYASSEGNVAFTNLFNFDNTVGFAPMKYAIVHYDVKTETPTRNKKGFMTGVKKGETGLLLGEISDKSPYDGYTDEAKTQQTILRDVFKKGDAYFNTGDLMRDIGFHHAQFVDRLGDTFRWKGENVSTTEVEQVLDRADGVAESVVYGVQVPGKDGRAGMACVRLDQEAERFDWQALSDYLQKELPAYAIPVFIRVTVQSMQSTSTFKYQKIGLKDEGYDLSRQDNPVYCWIAGESGYRRLDESLQKKIDDKECRL